MEGSDYLSWYRTGDMGRLNEHGDYEFYGRMDTQVKIHGHRVELESIESQVTPPPLRPSPQPQP